MMIACEHCGYGNEPDDHCDCDAILAAWEYECDCERDQCGSNPELTFFWVDKIADKLDLPWWQVAAVLKLAPSVAHAT